MATIYDLKPAFQNLLRPACRFCARNGITANAVTLAGVALSVAGGAAVAFNSHSKWPLLLMPAILFVRMALNAIDGMLAKEHDMKTRLGAVLNELGDVIADTALYLPLALVDGIPAWPLVIVTLLAIISEMTGVIGIQIGASRRYDGPMGKSDRAFVFGALALALGLGLPAGDWVEYLLWAVSALLVLTIFNRARRALLENDE
ncbi:MAG: CDP-alcohol phosphatidyltransferase family protein [Woeseiaceae bacterium]